MSIIYEALKKTQNKREVAIQTAIQPNSTKWKKVMMILIALSASIALLIYSPTIIKKFRPKPAPVAPAKIPLITLNGVFISPQNRLVEINHQFFRVGEMVNGMKIVGITYKKITFLYDNKLLELQVPA